MNKRSSLSVTTLAIVLFLSLLSSCSQSRVLDIGIGTTWSTLMSRVSDDYEQAYPHIRVEINPVGTSPAFKLLDSGDVQLVGAARDPVAEEQLKFNLEPAARDTLAIVSHVQSDLPAELSLEELKQLYTQDRNDSVVRIKKSSSHGTAVAFAKSLGVELGDVLGENEAGSNSEVLLLVSRIPKGVAYVSAPDAVQALNAGQPIRIHTLDGLFPVQADGSPTENYPLVRTLWLATRKLAGAADEAQRDAAQFIEYLRSESGQAVFRAAGFLPLLGDTP